jgi:hypothetical protein
LSSLSNQCQQDAISFKFCPRSCMPSRASAFCTCHEEQ